MLKTLLHRYSYSYDVISDSEINLKSLGSLWVSWSDLMIIGGFIWNYTITWSRNNDIINGCQIGLKAINSSLIDMMLYLSFYFERHVLNEAVNSCEISLNCIIPLRSTSCPNLVIKTCLDAKKFYVRRNKNKTNSIETGRTAIVRLLPWSNQENCSTFLIIDDKTLSLLHYNPLSIYRTLKGLEKTFEIEFEILRNGLKTKKSSDILYLLLYFHITNDIPCLINKIIIRITFTT